MDECIYVRNVIKPVFEFLRKYSFFLLKRRNFSCGWRTLKQISSDLRQVKAVKVSGFYLATATLDLQVFPLLSSVFFSCWIANKNVRVILSMNWVFKVETAASRQMIFFDLKSEIESNINSIPQVKQIIL